jgi:hypothetical protein
MMKKTLLGVAAGVAILTGIAVPTFAFAQDSGSNEFCNLMTPAVRDVVQDAPAIASVLNLNAAATDDAIAAQRANIGCANPGPAQTKEQARAEVCGVLTEARVEDLVDESNNPNATKVLESVKPALPNIIATARLQLSCDTKAPVTQGPKPSAPNEADDETEAPEKDAPPKATPGPEKDAPKAPQIHKAPQKSVETGW